MAIRERVEVIVDNVAATTYVGIASDGDAVHRVYCASAHHNSFVDYNVSTILSYDDTSLRKPYHITTGMGKDIYSLPPPPALLKTIFEPFNAHITLKPRNHICLRYFTR